HSEKRYEAITHPGGFRNLSSATSNNHKTTTELKPTINNDPTIAAGTPPDLPAGADAADAGITGIRGLGGLQRTTLIRLLISTFCCLWLMPLLAQQRQPRPPKPGVKEPGVQRQMSS